jgi:ceramide glucosyltransferase
MNVVSVVLMVIFAAAVLFGTLITCAAPFLVSRFVREWRVSRNAKRPAEAAPDGEPPLLSILKPLEGVDDELEQNLESFAAIPGLSYEVILSCAEDCDPAWDVVKRVKARHPGARFVCVTGGERGGGRPRNPKVDRLVDAMRHARGEYVLISDSNVRIAPGDFDATMRLLRDAKVGCVSNLFVGEGAKTLGSVIESLHLLTFVVPGTVMAALTKYPCVIGKSMAMPRKALEEIGGFEAFSNVLAEDEAIAMAIHGRGHEVLLSPSVVRNVSTSHTVGSALARQVRWCRIRFALAPGFYVAELLMNPLPMALAGAGAAALMAPAYTGAFLVAAAALAVLRVVQTELLDRATGRYLRRGASLLMPAKDLLMFGLHALGFTSPEVEWHGHRLRLGKGSRILTPEEPRSRRVPAREKHAVGG